MESPKLTYGVLLRYVLIFAILIMFLFPIYWMILTSFKSSEDILTRPPKFFFEPTLDNYRYAFE